MGLATEEEVTPAERERREIEEENAWRARCSTDREFREHEQLRLSRFICTAQAPYSAERAEFFGGRVVHPYAHEIDSADDDVARHECPICTRRWSAELPQ